MIIASVRPAQADPRLQVRARCRIDQWRTIVIALLTGAISTPVTVYAQEVPADAAPNQWFTGSLEAPSPALPKAGMLALEPYLVYQSNTGAYGSNGDHHTVADNTSTIESVLVIKYAITDKLTFEALPAISHSSADHAAPTGTSFGDLPVELEYSVMKGNYKTGAPTVTLDLGVTAPTGEYDRLQKPLEGVGGGAWLLKQGVVAQSLFDTWGNHPVRLRAWAEVFEPLQDATVNDASVYGTAAGFHGRAAPGISGQVGLAGGWAIDQRWVLAIDFVDTYANGYRAKGFDATQTFVQIQGPIQNSFAIAPAIEYNWSANAGLIFGLEFSAAGRNTASYVAPQIALAVSF